MKKISLAVIKRLPRYYRYLSSLEEKNIDRISSKELSERMQLTASQVRQDFNCFGGFGQQGYGYNISNLKSEIANILGINKNKKVIIVGVGHLGQALANYKYFKNQGFQIVGLFDVDDNKIGREINGMKILHYDNVDTFLKENEVDIAVLSVPYDKTKDTARHLAELGVKGFWNFAPKELKVSDGIVVENVHLVDSLMVLGYNIDNEDSTL